MSFYSMIRSIRPALTARFFGGYPTASSMRMFSESSKNDEHTTTTIETNKGMPINEGKLGSAIKLGSCSAPIFHKHAMPDKSLFVSRVDISPATLKDLKIADLPPPIRKLRTDPDGSQTILQTLTKEQIAEVVRLREEDPVHWTRNRLAKKFGCSHVFIGMIAKCPQWRIAEIQAQNEQKWLKMGYKKRLIKVNRLKRRLAW